MSRLEGAAEAVGIVRSLRMFPMQEGCIAWPERVRWNGRPVCAHCGGAVKIDTIGRTNAPVRAAGGKRIRYRDPAV